MRLRRRRRLCRKQLRILFIPRDYISRRSCIKDNGRDAQVNCFPLSKRSLDDYKVQTQKNVPVGHWIDRSRYESTLFYREAKILFLSKMCFNLRGLLKKENGYHLIARRRWRKVQFSNRFSSNRIVRWPTWRLYSRNSFIQLPACSRELSFDLKWFPVGIFVLQYMYL